MSTTLLRCEVWVKGAPDYEFQITQPAVIPRVGERIEFSNGVGVVESVTWIPGRWRPTNADMLIVIECSAPEEPSSARPPRRR